MLNIAITGASGFIGQQVGALFRAQGSTVIELRRTPGQGGIPPWALGDALPNACRRADTIVHLASATLVDSARLRESIDRDVEGTRIIVDQVRQWRREGRPCRFVFMSSQSAKPQASNGYGRSKWAIEQSLHGDDEIIVRPGLVYDDYPRSVFSTFDRLSRFPIVPIISDRPNIQPIHVREVAACVAKLAAMDRPPRLVKIGAIEPLTFRDAIRATARRAGRKPPLLLTLPVRPVKLTARIVDRVFQSTLTERLDGLVGLDPMETEESLLALDQVLIPF